MAVALLDESQIAAIAEQAAERAVRKVLDETRATELTTAQAAEILGIAPKTLLKWMKAGRVPMGRKHGKDYRFKAADIDAAKKGGPTSAAARATLKSVGIG